jgi:hypothetical protein
MIDVTFKLGPSAKATSPDVERIMLDFTEFLNHGSDTSAGRLLRLVWRLAPQQQPLEHGQPGRAGGLFLRRMSAHRGCWACRRHLGRRLQPVESL